MLLGGRYRLLSTPVSNGSFGAVYAAEDERMPRRVAVKILHAQHATNVTVRERFRRELAAVCRVQHENVVSVFDVGEDDRLGLYYVMELVNGTPLRDRISDTPPPWPFVYRVACQLGRALNAIHAADIVHRDLKPQNIMLVERDGFDELVKVLDFGIASIRENNEDPLDAVLTGARNVLGTPPYMAPEQTYMRADRLRLGLDVDTRSDIYALGVVLYELLSGRRPFTGDAHSVVLAHRNVAPMPLDRIAGLQAPRDFLKVVMRCLEKRSEDRPQTAREFLDLVTPTERLPVSPRMTDAVLTLPDPVDDDAPTEMFFAEAAGDADADRDPVATWRARRRRRWLGLGALLTLLAASGLAWALSMPTDDSGTSVLSAAVTGADAPTEEAATRDPDPVPEEPAPAPVVAVDDAAAAEPPAEEVPEAAAPNPMTLVVTSTPNEVDVTLDGTPAGKTPLTLPLELREGQFIEVRLSKEGYEDRTIEVIPSKEDGNVLLVHETLEKVRRAPTGPAVKVSEPRPRVPRDPFDDL